MAEQYTNLAQSTTTGLNNTTNPVTFSVATGEGSKFPATTNGSFRLVVEPNTANQEILLVTSRTGDSMTANRAQEGTSAVAHGSSVTVTHVLTTGAMDQIRQDLIAKGTYATLPASLKAANLYIGTDNQSYLLRDNGSAWDAWAGLEKVTLPVSGDYTGIDSPTLSSTNGGMSVTGATTGSLQARLAVKTLSAAPYTLTAMFRTISSPESTGGLVLRASGAGTFIIIYPSANGLTYQKWTNTTTASANYLNDVAIKLHNPYWVQIQDDNTNRIVRVSSDGMNWMQIHSVGRTDFLTPNQMGFGVFTTASTYTGVLLAQHLVTV